MSDHEKKLERRRLNKKRRNKLLEPLRGAPGKPGPDYAIGPAEANKIYAVVALGGSLKDAAIHAGIDETTLFRHRKRDPEFRRELESAEVTGKLLLMKRVSKATRHDWRAAQWLLQTRWGSQFGTIREGDVESSVSEYLRRRVKKAVTKALDAAGLGDKAELVCQALDAEAGGDEGVEDDDAILEFAD